MAQRYLHPTAYRPSFEELTAWMARHGDEPTAPRIQDLARHRPPAATPGAPLAWKRFEAFLSPERPIAVSLSFVPTTPFSKELDDAPVSIGETQPTNRPKRLAPSAAARATERWIGRAPEARWNEGLVAWRSGSFGSGAQHFELVAQREDASPWIVSAAAFWAARAHLFNRHPENVTRWLHAAASHFRTFYGLLGLRILGLPMPFEWRNPVKEQAALAGLVETQPGRRALALLQVGQRPRAELELQSLASRARGEVARSVVAAAHISGLAELALRLNSALFPEGGGFDAADYPIPDWTPEGGFTVDRALIYALIRQESRFKSDAASPAGARGLMQLMPTTARYVAGSIGYPAVGSTNLREPEINLMLGQKYLEMLLEDETVGGDLFRLAAAWNGGPGNLQK